MGALANTGVTIVGPGRVGQAMGKLLARAEFPILYIAARHPAAARRARLFIGRGRPIALGARQLTEAATILVTTADSALPQLAQDLAVLREDWSGKVVLHTCGSVPASVLLPLKLRGAAVGSLHPFQTVPNPLAGVRNLSNCFWGIEGDRRAREVAIRWVEALGGVAFRVRPSQKTLYHAAAFLVCPTLVTLMNYSIRLLRRAGVPPKIARPMLGKFVAQTARSFVDLGARRALTGPAARGDWPTLQRHLSALRRFSPDIIPIYTALVRAMLRLAGRRPARALRRMFPA